MEKRSETTSKEEGLASVEVKADATAESAEVTADTEFAQPPVEPPGDVVIGGIEPGDRPTLEVEPVVTTQAIRTPAAEPVSSEVFVAAEAVKGSIESPVEAIEDLDELAAEVAAHSPASDETIIRCNGCGRPGPEAATAAESLEKALASGWFMSDHEPPLPYCCGRAVEPGRLAGHPMMA